MLKICYVARKNFGHKLIAAACTLYEWMAVSTFRNSRVCFMSSDRYAAKRTVILCNHIIFALWYSTLDWCVFLHRFHKRNLLLKKYCSRGTDSIIDVYHKNMRLIRKTFLPKYYKTVNNYGICWHLNLKMILYYHKII